MGAALGGLLGSGWAAPEQIAVVESAEERRHELERDFPGVPVLGAPPDDAPGPAWRSSPMWPKGPAGSSVRSG